MANGTNNALHSNSLSDSDALASYAGSHRALDAARRWQRGSIPPLLLAPAPLLAHRCAVPIDRVQLGRSPTGVSRVIFGAMAIAGARYDRARRIRTIQTALDVGITSIDSDPLYDLGACEETVGEAIRGARHEIQILSKVGLRWDDPHGPISFTTRNAHGRKIAVRKNARPESLRLEVERSLDRLGVDVLDVVQLHSHDPSTPIEDTLGALADLMREGKLRAIGVSTDFGPRDIARAQHALGAVPLASIQVCYNLLERRCEAELVPLALEKSIGVLARSPLAMGLLSGRIGATGSFGDHDPRQKRSSFQRDDLLRVALALKQGLAPIAADRGVSIAAVALAWVLQRPAVSAIVVGASHPRQARANAEAVALELEPDEEESIRKAFEGVTLDPSAGLGLARRALVQGRWLLGALGRRLTR